MKRSEQFEKGFAIRREVLGAEYVDASFAKANEFNIAMQELTTEWCWGATWSRPVLSRKTRSIMNIVMLTALNRSNELRLHVRGAVNNGCTKDEIREALLHATVYCGVPAGLEGFKVANEVLIEMGKVDPTPVQDLAEVE